MMNTNEAASTTKDIVVPSFRFTVDIKTSAGQTALLQYQNLVQLAKQNTALQTLLLSQPVQNNSKKSKKRKKSTTVKSDDESDEDETIDENKEYDLESSDGGETTEDSTNSDGEIKFGEEGREAVEPKKKRLRKNNTVVNPMNLLLRTEEELEWDVLQEKNTHVSRLGTVISNIESRERSLKNNLLKKTVQKMGGDYVEAEATTEKVSRKGDFYVYSSDDSFIDDTEYNDYLQSDEEVEMPGSTSKRASDFYVVAKVADPNAVHEEDVNLSMDSISDHEHDNHGLVEPIETDEMKKQRKTSYAASDDASDEPLEPEIEEAIEVLKKKSATLDKTTFQTIPHELDEELLQLSLLREKYYKRGVPARLLKRLRQINGLKFTDKTIKERMKTVLTKFGTNSLTKGIEEMKVQLKDSIAEDMISALQKKRERDVKSKKETTTEDYASLDFESLKQKMKDTEGVRLIWSKKSMDLIMKLGQQKEQWIEKENAARKMKKGSDMLDVNEELQKLFRELRAFTYKPMDLFKKYKSLKEKEEKKDLPKDATKPATATSTEGKKEEGKEEPKDADGKKKEEAPKKKKKKKKKQDMGEKKDEKPDEERVEPRLKKKKEKKDEQTEVRRRRKKKVVDLNAPRGSGASVQSAIPISDSSNQPSFAPQQLQHETPQPQATVTSVPSILIPPSSTNQHPATQFIQDMVQRQTASQQWLNNQQ